MRAGEYTWGWEVQNMSMGEVHVGKELAGLD